MEKTKEPPVANNGPPKEPPILKTEPRAQTREPLFTRAVLPERDIGRGFRTPEERERATWLAAAKYVGFSLGSKAMLGLIYLTLIADGLAALAEPLSMKLFKIPGFWWMRDYEITYRLTLAHPFALFILACVFASWPLVVRMWLRWHDFDHEGWDGDRNAQFLVVISAITLVGEAAVFYMSLVEVSWSDTAFSPAALVGTALWVAVLAWVSYVNVNLYEKYHTLKENRP